MLAALWLLALLVCLLWCCSCLFCWCCPARARNALSSCAGLLFIAAILITAFYTHKLHALFAGTQTVALNTYRFARLAADIARRQ